MSAGKYLFAIALAVVALFSVALLMSTKTDRDALCWLAGLFAAMVVYSFVEQWLLGREVRRKHPEMHL